MDTPRPLRLGMGLLGKQTDPEPQAKRRRPLDAIDLLEADAADGWVSMDHTPAPRSRWVPRRPRGWMTRRR